MNGTRKFHGPCYDYQGVADYRAIGLGQQREYRHRGTGGNFTVIVGREAEFATAARACQERFEAGARQRDGLLKHAYATATPEGEAYQITAATIEEARARCGRFLGRPEGRTEKR